ncbi:hypothetical protein EJ04DRAFT_516996 [Polyplosphaeria fusca]|uniref:Zn(2)-C6 fungal-type domain-containing protein n=1 Tax=Polyplosphaeria fusca TaxID=682080 RepID=A0A9P4QJZ1_9PLEO|nr:hypothetical protein EJ04DRAFT_516996 [Polyplosphaeria fusca]
MDAALIPGGDSPASNVTAISGGASSGTLAPPSQHAHGDSEGSPSSTREEKNPKRRAHRKSRLGCHNCKGRRIKCDERRPECSNCIKRQVRCDYLGSPAASSDSPLAQAFQPQGNLNIDDVELTFYWTTSTCPTLSTWPSGTEYWRTNTTPLALSQTSSPHTLHLILCFTALHLATSRPARSTHYTALADQHYAAALPLVASSLPTIPTTTTEQTDSILASVQLICFIHLARGPQPDEYLAFSTRGSTSEWLSVFKGIRATLETLGQNWLSRPHALNVHHQSAHRLPVSADPPDFEAPLAHLRAHIPAVSTNVEIDEEALEFLLESFRTRYTTAVDSEYYVCFRWFYKMTHEFLEGLQRREVVPLILLAHWLVLLGDMERFWYVKGWTAHVMGGIWEVLAAEHRTWVRWAMARVGWIPP